MNSTTDIQYWLNLYGPYDKTDKKLLLQAVKRLIDNGKYCCFRSGKGYQVHGETGLYLELPTEEDREFAIKLIKERKVEGYVDQFEECYRYNLQNPHA